MRLIDSLLVVPICAAAIFSAEPVFALTSTYYPYYNGCGNVQYTSTTWYKTREYSIGSVVSKATAQTDVETQWSGSTYNFRRTFMAFDLSGISADATIRRVELCSKGTRLNVPYPLKVVQGNQSSTSTLSVSDYNKYDISKVYGTFDNFPSAEAWWTCTDLETSYFVKGWNKLALLNTKDFNNSSSTSNNWYSMYCNSNTKLQVTYTTNTINEVTYYRDMPTSTLIYAISNSLDSFEWFNVMTIATGMLLFLSVSVISYVVIKRRD